MTTLSAPRSFAYVVHRLVAGERDAIAAHLTALDPTDRSLRFGVAADAAAIARYVESIDFERGAVLGAVTREGVLAGVAHLALDGASVEVGLSVLPGDRQRGVAGRLAAAALREAERLGAAELCIHFAATNRGMRRIAERLGMEITTNGSDATARRRLLLELSGSPPRRFARVAPAAPSERRPT